MHAYFTAFRANQANHTNTSSDEKKNNNVPFVNNFTPCPSVSCLTQSLSNDCLFVSCLSLFYSTPVCLVCSSKVRLVI